MSESIVWVCDRCERPVLDGAGYLAVSYAELRRHEEAELEHRAKLREKYGPDEPFVVSLADFVDGPSLVPWRILHRRCDPNPDSVDYWIAVERIRSQAQALDWCAHLFETKSWLQVTDWPRIARIAAVTDNTDAGGLGGGETR